jgi:hypothetical protein
VTGCSLVVIWGLIYPIAMDIALNKRRKKFHLMENLKLFGVFYIGLNDDSYYWEVRIVNLRKILLILSAALITNSYQDIKVSPIRVLIVIIGLCWDSNTPLPDLLLSLDLSLH